MSDSWHAYPSIFNLGHKAIEHLTDVPVNVEEKVDGSQFSFGLIDGQLRVKSKSVEMNVEAPEKMFTKAVRAVRDAHEQYGLQPEWTYRAEFLGSPKHNVLKYEHVPKSYLIVFDINDGQESYLDHTRKTLEAERLGFEAVPLMYCGFLQGNAGLEILQGLLKRTSVLGGVCIEGVVIKPTNYGLFGTDKKVLMGKFVSEAFKEKHRTEWKSSNPTGGDVVQALCIALKSEARWAKARQHLRERGELLNAPQDIPKLLKEVHTDIIAEEREQIIQDLWKYAWPKISRAATNGLPEWYKEQLLKEQFKEKDNA